MPEILRTAVLGARPLVEPRPVLDPVTQRIVDEAVAAAEARGFAAGEAAGRAAALGAMQQAADRVTVAADRVCAEVADQRREMVAVSLELAEAAATAVLSVAPPPEARAVLDRVREATDLLDDDRLELRTGPADAAMLQEAVADPRVTVVADAHLADGDVEVVGAWGRVDLRRERLVGAALALLTETGEVTP